MTSQVRFYETTELKLAAILLVEIPETNYKVLSQGNSIKKTFQITYSTQYEEEFNKLIREFIERRARVDVYKYNQILNTLRDKLKER
jgi:hypothetical protein